MIQPDLSAAARARHLNALLADCRQQMAQFRATGADDPTPCLALFRYAVLRRDPAAWEALVFIYRPQIQRHILRVVNPGPDQLEELTQLAVVKFWRTYTPERLAHARSLGEILRYWNDCCRSVACDYLRREKRAAQHLGRSLDDDGDTGEESPYARIRAATDVPRDSARARIQARLWALVDQTCNDETDHEIAQLVFVEGKKPREALGLLSDTSLTIQDVYRRIRNLKDRLSRIPELAELLDELRA